MINFYIQIIDQIINCMFFIIKKNKLKIFTIELILLLINVK